MEAGHTVTANRCFDIDAGQIAGFNESRSGRLLPRTEPTFTTPEPLLEARHRFIWPGEAPNGRKQSLVIDNIDEITRRITEKAAKPQASMTGRIRPQLRQREPRPRLRRGHADRNDRQFVPSLLRSCVELDFWVVSLFRNAIHPMSKGGRVRKPSRNPAPSGLARDSA